MESLYVCLFDNGHIKVGRSIDPVSRIAAHAERVSCMGIDLVCHHLEECVNLGEQREADLIRRCVAAADNRFKSEWFTGLDYVTVCGWAGECARLQLLDGPAWRIIFQRRNGFQARLKQTYGIPPQTSNNWRLAIPAEYCARVETACKGEFRRWDFRPNDWHLIWPELIGTDGAPAILTGA